MSQSWIGQRVPRHEDRRLLLGAGRYVADLQLPDQVEMHVLRSSEAHAAIRRVAGPAPGSAALDFLDAADLAGRVGTLPMMWVVPGMRCDSFPVLEADRARYVGQPLAALVAASRYAAEDAAERVTIDYAPLPAVVDVERAVAPDASLLYPAWGDNVAYRWEATNGDIAAAFARADLTVRQRFAYPRHAPLPLETRGVVATYDRASEELTVWLSSQIGPAARTTLAETLRFPEHRLRLIVPDVGGAFGAKLHLYPEEVLACLFALRLGRPVRWIEDRREHLLATIQAREQRLDVEVAARADGTLLGVRARVLADIGAHPHSRGGGASFVTIYTIPGPYRVGAYGVELLGVVTNKVPFGAYRGYGKPQAVLAMERCVDAVAARLGLDPAEVRRRNLVGPREMPFPSPGGRGQFDSGDYPAGLRRALAAIGWERRRAEHAALRARGIRRGLGLACFAEGTGLPGSTPLKDGQRQSPHESAEVRLEPTGTAVVAASLLPSGQGHATTLAQICASELGLRPGDVQVLLGDSDRCPYSGYGTAASRGMSTGGSAVLLAARDVREQLLRLAGHLLEVAPADLTLADGRLAVRGLPERHISVAAVARHAYRGDNLPAGQPPELLGRRTFNVPASVYSYATNACEIEVDAETGALRVLQYVVVDDCGVVVNPTIVDGQVVGGVAQGLGGALLEELRYDAAGQLQSGTLLDYLTPTAVDVPTVRIEHLCSPSPHTPGGFKGVGESGTVGVSAALTNALMDALRPTDPALHTLPLTPERVLALVARSPYQLH